MASTFLLMGMVVSAFGPLLPLVVQRFGVSLPVAGSIISAYFAGCIGGMVAGMRTLALRPARETYLLGLGVGGAGCVATGLAARWPLFLGGIAMIGLGYGFLVIGLNQLVAYSRGGRRTATLNGLNGAYSIGAVAGPLVVAAFARGHLSVLFALAGAAALVLMVPALTVSGRLPQASGAAGGRPETLVGIFALALVFYDAIEVGTGGWMTTHLQFVGLIYNQAAGVTSGFFLAIAAGRLLSTLTPARVPESVVVLGGAAAATIALGLTTYGPLAPAAYIVAGLALAPIFPTAIAWLAKSRPGDPRATSWIYPAASFGGVVGPGLIGVVIAASSVRWTPVVLAAIAVLMTAAFLATRRSAA